MEELIISSDSHVIEPPDLWEKNMPAALRERAPKIYFDEKRDAWMFGAPECKSKRLARCSWLATRPKIARRFRKEGFKLARPGGWDPIARKADMATDGVCAEVLYPSLGLGLYCIEDAAFQEALFRTFNDWMIDYCSKVPDRLYGIGLISMYNVDHAIAEMERCKKAGMVGTMIWQVPDSQAAVHVGSLRAFLGRVGRPIDMPVHLHILTGFGDSMNRQTAQGIHRCRIGVEQTREIESALFDIIFTGVLDRYPKLKIVSVENEVGWMPFWIGQCDKGFKRHRHAQKLPIDKLPSEYFYGQVFSTFFNDHVGGKMFSWWGVDNCMWSNDYPHQNSTWPNSRAGHRARHGRCEAGGSAKLLFTNCEKLYNLKVPASLPVAA